MAQDDEQAPATVALVDPVEVEEYLSRGTRQPEPEAVAEPEVEEPGDDAGHPEAEEGDEDQAEGDGEDAEDEGEPAPDDPQHFDRGRYRADLAKLEKAAEANAGLKPLVGQIRALEKTLLADHTRKTTEAAEARRGAERQVQEAEARLEAHGAFLERLRTDAATAETFLVEVALASPDLMEAVTDRVRAIQDDPAEEKRFAREKALAKRERKAEEEDRVAETRALEARQDHILGLMSAELGTAGVKVTEEVAGLVGEAVQAAILREGRDISDEKVRAVVRRVSGTITRERERAAETARKRLQKDGRKETKERALAGKTGEPAKEQQPPGRLPIAGPPPGALADEDDPYGLHDFVGLRKSA